MVSRWFCLYRDTVLKYTFSHMVACIGLHQQKYTHCLFWMNCNNLMKVNNQDVVIRWNKWDFEMCTESIIPWHHGKSCYEDTEFRYAEVAKGKGIQMCPLWGKFMEKTKKCNHLTCQRCMSNFWMFWRNKYTKNHLNPLNAQACSSLQKAQKGCLVSKMPSVSTKLSSRLVLLFLFLWISPLFVLILLPYIWCKNFLNSSSKTKKSWLKRWGRTALALTWLFIIPLWAPITWCISIICIFLLFCKFSCKNNRSKIYAKKRESVAVF